MANMLIDDRDLIQPENKATRIPVVLCLDTSGSMDNNGSCGFNGLNLGVKTFYNTCKNDSAHKYGFDVAIVTFGNQGVKKYQDFRPIWNDDEIPSFSFDSSNWIDGTPLGRGIDLAMQGLQKRKNEYKENGIGYYQPWLVIITDGQPTFGQRDLETGGYAITEEEDMAAYVKTQTDILELQRNKKLWVIAVGVGDEDYSQLANFVIDKKVLVMEDFSAFDLVFEFLSKSMSASSDMGAGSNVSPLAMVQEDLEDEGVSISIEEFGRDED